MKRDPRRLTLPKVAEDVVIPEPEVFTDPDFANGDPTLQDDEVAFFKKNGFLIKRGLLTERDALARIVDHVWETAPPDIVKRDEPETWFDAPHGRWTEADVDRAGLFSRGSWKMRSRDVIGREPFLLDQTANHPRMRQVVSAFIGEPVKRCGRVRGVYGVFPDPPDATGSLSPHADQTAAQLSAMVIVDEIPPHCGGFTIWPGSHHIVHAHCDAVHGPMGSSHANAYAQARDEILRIVTPVEFPGAVGDVVFWHPRLLHSGGINQSAQRERPVLRLIVPCDYQKDGMSFFDDLIEGPGPNHQWWVDTRNFHGDVPPTPDNIWDGWAIA
jgi:hypothetical protein